MKKEIQIASFALVALFILNYFFKIDEPSKSQIENRKNLSQQISFEEKYITNYEKLGLGKDLSGFKNYIKDNKANFIELQLYDDMVEDGDVISINSEFFTKQISLTKIAKTHVIPVFNKNIKIIGIKDGGGGITASFINKGQKIKLPIISENEIIDLRVF